MFLLSPTSHSLVPIVPKILLDYVQLPSTYLMGIHSSLREEVDELVRHVITLSSLLSFSLVFVISPPPSTSLPFFSLPHFFSTSSLSAPLPLILPSFLTSLLLPPSLPLHHFTTPLPLLSLPPTPSLRLCCQDDVIEVYLDYGDVHIPDTLQLPSLPMEVLEPVQWALSRVLDPGMGHRDSVFGRPLPNKTKSLELQVKTIVVDYEITPCKLVAMATTSLGIGLIHTCK